MGIIETFGKISRRILNYFCFGRCKDSSEAEFTYGLVIRIFSDRVERVDMLLQESRLSLVSSLG